MFAVPYGPIWTAILASGQQMTMALDETLRLKTARVVKAFENPLEKTRSPFWSATGVGAVLTHGIDTCFITATPRSEILVWGEWLNSPLIPVRCFTLQKKYVVARQ
jgi:hypothetical protein